MEAEVGRGLPRPGSPSTFTPLLDPRPALHQAHQLTSLSQAPSPLLWDWCQVKKGTLALTESGNSRPP